MKIIARSTIVLGAAIGMVAMGMAPIAPATRTPDGPGAKRTWDFEGDPVGRIPTEFTGVVGDWKVAEDGKNHVLAQTARNPDDIFNVALVDDARYRDVDLTVRLKAVAGEVDRGGGLVWRARDAKNHYIARYNPLEDNFRVYKVADGKRTMFQGARVAGDSEWHTLRVTMEGDHIRCAIDGKFLLDVRDSTFPDAGKIGLWSKADAQSWFDDLTASGR